MIPESWVPFLAATGAVWWGLLVLGALLWCFSWLADRGTRPATVTEPPVDLWHLLDPVPHDPAPHDARCFYAGRLECVCGLIADEGGAA